LHPELKPKKFNGKKKKTTTTIQKDLGSDPGDETIVIATSIKGKNSEASTSNSAQSIDNEENERKDMSFFILELFLNIKRLILYLIVVHKKT